MNVLNQDGLPKEGIRITCPDCADEVNLDLEDKSSVHEWQFPWVEFSGDCQTCHKRIVYRRRNPGRDAKSIFIEVL